MKHLIFFQLKIFRNKIRKLSFLDEIKIAFFIFLGSFFLLGVYFGAWRLLSYINQVAIVGALLVNKLLSLVFLSAFSMVVLSGLITSFNTIYFGRDLSWLMVSPLSIRHIFAFKSMNTVFYSSWMVFIVLMPFLLALGQVKNLSVSFYILSMLLLVPFLTIASMLGIMISLLLMRFFPYHKTRDMLLALSAVFVTGLYILFRFLQPERLVKPDGLEIVAQYLSYLDAPTAVFLPSWWVTGGIYSLISGSGNDLLFYSGLLAGVAVICVIVTVGMAEKMFYIGWAEGSIFGRRNKFNLTEVKVSARTPFKSLFLKDLLAFFRDVSQWSQLLFLGALVLVYLFSIYKLPLETMYLQNLVSFFNVGLIGFVLSAVSLRFVYPSVSLEGESFWLLRSAPLSVKGFLAEKYFFGLIPVASAGIILVTVSSWLLKVDLPIFCMSLAAILIISFGLSSLAVGFGSIFPVFNYTSIAQIESSPGGLFYIVAAVFYLGLNISLWAWPVQNYYRFKFGTEILPWNYLWWAGGSLVLINVISVYVPLYFGYRSLENIEK